jgi:5-methyltetrahydrofolate--homocysteine methyltransferase
MPPARVGDFSFMSMKQHINPFLSLLREKVIILDGATGTHLQGQSLTPDDFGGEHLAGCNEHLVFSCPGAVERVHEDYLAAGCDVIETNSFGSTSIVLAEYDLQDKVYELNLEAARIAKKVASGFTTSGKPRFVAGSLGPGTKLPSLGHIPFMELADAFAAQSRGLIDGGVDILCIETCQDILQAKAALYGVHSVFREMKRRLPIILSVTMEATGTMLLGTDITAALTTIEPFDVDIFGLNCATGPREMSEHVRSLSDTSPFPLFIMPNAGMPENVGGHAHYPLGPEEYVRFMTSFIKDQGVNVVGGCCGTTPEHIGQLVDAVGNTSPVKRNPVFEPAASSLYQTSPFRIDNPPILVGERTNANGSKLFRELLAKDDWEGIVGMGKEQVREQAHMLDVCAAYVGRNESKDMEEIISRFNQQVTIPLVIDSTEPEVIEEALRRIGGKAVVNSINLEDGEERLRKIVGMCKDYGAAVIALTIDEEGMAKTADAKLRIARRIYDLAVTQGGMRPHDLIFDTLTFTLGSGDEEFRRAGIETIDAIRRVNKEMPEVQTILGVSNISFGLSPGSRTWLNSVFLHFAVEAGLSMAIVHASKIIPLFKIDPAVREVCQKLVYDERSFEGEGDERKVLYDPLTELMNLSAAVKGKKEVKKEKAKTVEERLKNRIIDGDKVGLQGDLEEARKVHPPLEIINTFLLDGMKVVGELFGSGQMQLPFVLQSAEVMKAAVAYLEPFMDKAEGSARGIMVIATVKGDVHDIGKNLVDIILTNNGFKVVNLGIKVPVDTILKAAEEEKADAVGMSGLLVKSTLIMKENLQIMQERDMTMPVVLGGAALTRRFVENDLRAQYAGPVYYAKDAFDGLRLMEKILEGDVAQDASASETEKPVVEEVPTGEEAKMALAAAEEGTVIVSDVRRDHSIPTPPFWGSKVVDDIELSSVYEYINDVALIRGQWRITKGKMAPDAYEAMLRETIYPEYAALKEDAMRRKLLVPKVVYGYFPCHSKGDDVIIYDPEEWQRNQNLTEKVRFSFPRQKKGRGYCIADFLAPLDSGTVDVISMHAVTVGQQATEYATSLFEADAYKEYLYFHGLSVETAEALAEYWHKRIREELGIGSKDAGEIKRLFSQGYQGSRYSFGYPACPNLEDQTKLFDLLGPERIGITLTDEFQLDPEQSTTALVIHHPDARYFTI